MTDELLPHYDRELSYLRKLGAEFAAAHPKVAGRLRLSAETIEDPHVSRLVESVAFLNARIRRKLDDEFPELTEALLGALYPHYLAPIPSMAIVQFECDREFDKSFTVPAGAQLATDRMHGEPCSFRSAYKVETWPIDVAQARLVSAPFDAPRTARSKTAAAVLQIELAPKNPKLKLSALAPRELRFYLHGAPQHTHLLYELILHDALEIAISAAPNDPQPALLGAEALKPVGFGAHEGLLPYPPQSFLGYRLLTEFFVFPAKFLFFDLTQLPPAKLAQLGSKLWINIYLRRSNSDVEQNVSAATFALGCTPVVNLFKKRAEPIIVDATVPEHHVVPDARRGLAHEVYSIDRLTALLPGDREQACLPFFGLDRHANDDERAVWWSAARRSAPSTEGAKDDGTELWLTLVDHGVLEGEKEVRLAVETTCMNRDLPNRLPFGGDQPRMAFAEGGGPVKRIRCLTAPTPTRRPARSDEGLWKLVSHLSLNHLSLTGGPDAKVALREILRLYDPTGAAEIKSLLDGITEVSSKPAVLRALDKGQPWLGRGTQVTIKLDSQRFGGMGLYLFASVLDHFLGLYCALNSFVQLVVVPSDRDGELRWPPRAGNKPLL